MKKRLFLRIFLFLVFVVFIFISPAIRGVSFSEKIQISVGGSLLCFLSPLIGRWIAVKIFHCPEWDKDDDMGE